MSLLCENAAKVEEDICEFLNKNNVSDWNTLRLIKTILSKYLIIDSENDLNIFSTQYKTALTTFQTHCDPKKAEEAKRRLPALAKLMESTHVTDLFTCQLKDNNQASAVLAVKSNVVRQAHGEIEREDHQTTQAQQASKRPNEGYSLRGSTKQKKQKKQKATTPTLTLKNLDPEECLKLLTDSKDCKNNVIDFTKPISKKFKPAIPKIMNHFNFNLDSAITLEERRILIDLSLCNTIEDENKLLSSLFQKNDVSENIKYLRAALNGLFDIWRSKRLNDINNEGWLRSNLYSFIWDRAFLFDETFYVKRAECYSAVIRKLKENNEDIGQQRVDFILRSNHDGTDYLTSEEKPTDQEARYDFNKGKKMQQHMLKLWSGWLGSTVLVGELEAVTCQWQQRKLIVFGTRLLPSGHFIVYKKATATISPVSGHYAGAARLIQIVLSIKRLVTLNHMKLIAMINAIEKYSNEHLDLSVNTDQPFVTFYGSSQESQNSTDEEKEPEFVQQALLASRSVKHPDEIVGVGDWEKMMIDDVNEELQIEK